jgi:hypothetical protein
MNPIPPQASAWLELAKIIKDPFLVFSLTIIAILAWIIFALMRSNQSHVGFERDLMKELSDNSVTLARLAALVETLVHGRGGSK